MDNVQIAQALFEAFEKGDVGAVRALCISDVTASQNGGSPMDLNALLAFSGAVARLVANFRYENVRRRDTADGFVEEHAVRGTLPDGSPVDIAACVVGDIVEGRVTALREYLDSAAARGLIRALEEAAGAPR